MERGRGAAASSVFLRERQQVGEGESLWRGRRRWSMEGDLIDGPVVSHEHASDQNFAEKNAAALN